jgi:hypothetical protein
MTNERIERINAAMNVLRFMQDAPEAALEAAALIDKAMLIMPRAPVVSAEVLAVLVRAVGLIRIEAEVTEDWRARKVMLAALLLLAP